MRVSVSYNKLEKPSGNVRFPYGSPFRYPTIGIRPPIVGFCFLQKTFLFIDCSLSSANYFLGTLL